MTLFKCKVVQLTKAMAETENNFNVIFLRGGSGEWAQGTPRDSAELTNEEVLEADRAEA